MGKIDGTEGMEKMEDTEGLGKMGETEGMEKMGETEGMEKMQRFAKVGETKRVEHEREWVGKLNEPELMQTMG